MTDKLEDAVPPPPEEDIFQDNMNIFDGEEDETENKAENNNEVEEDNESAEGEAEGDAEAEGEAEEGAESNEEEEDADEIFRQKEKKKRKRKEKESSKGKKGKAKKLARYNFFNEEAEVASDEEEEDYEAAEQEEILDKDHLDAIARVQKRHDVNREFQKKSEADLVADIERRYQYQEQIKQQYEDADGFIGQQATPVAQQALLPSFKDPKLFKIKCKPTHELIAVRAIMLKTIDMFNRQRDFYKIKSAFCGSSKGYIYVEALNEAFAKEVLTGLKMIYLNSFQQVPIDDMTTVLGVTITKKPLKAGQYIRIKRGVLKGDLARIVNVFDGETKALIQAVPRLQYGDGAGDSKNKITLSGNKIRPAQALFDAEQASNSSNGYVFRRHHPLDPSSALYDVWNGKYYKDGFLFDEVNVETSIDNTDVKPKLEELKMFAVKKPSKPVAKKTQKNPEDEEEEDDEEQDDTEDPVSSTMNADLAKEIERLNEESEGKTENPFTPGDLVQVIGGELINLVGRVISINDVYKSAKIRPYNNTLLTEDQDVELNLLVKYVFPGAHVKVMTGKYSGQTGRVVHVISDPGVEQLAVILTDGLNTEIKCNVSLLQLSDEVATGLGNLMGFELYDLVALSENESAVIVNVGTEKLRVVNHMEAEKDVSPQEIRSKLNLISNRSRSMDGFHNTFGVGDSVHVVSGTHQKKSGTVKHINKRTVWIHSNNYLKNSGIFVVKGENCMLAGGSSAVVSSHDSRSSGGGRMGGPGSQQSTPSTGITRSPFQKGPGSRDPNEARIGETVKIIKGGYKGHLAQVADITSSHYSVELLTKFKKIVIPKSSVIRVGDKLGAFDKVQTNPLAHIQPEYAVAASTPYLSAQTPLHVLGSETPRVFGSETPYGGMASYDEDDSAWKVSDSDKVAALSSSQSLRDDSSQISFSRTTTPAMTDFTGTPQNFVHGSNLSTPFSNNITTPMSVVSSSAYQDPSAADSNFIPGMVVGVKRGKLVGKFAVIHQLLPESGQCRIRVRDGNGRLQDEEIALPLADIGPVDPPKGAFVFVLRGPHKGRSGVVKLIQGKEITVQFNDESNSTDVLPLKNSVAWLNRAEGF